MQILHGLPNHGVQGGDNDVVCSGNNRGFALQRDQDSEEFRGFLDTIERDVPTELDVISSWTTTAHDLLPKNSAS